MGQSKSTEQKVQENGVVNSNFIVQEQEYNVTKDVKIVIYLILACLLAMILMKLFRVYHKQLKKQARRNLAEAVSACASKGDLSAV